MGGPGSGRWSSYPTTLDDFLRFDLRYLRRRGLLTPGVIGSLRWRRGGRETGSIRFQVAVEVITLAYWVRARGSQGWAKIREPVRLVRTRQPLGGERLWLACPGCGRRCAVLYGGRRFVCRRCVGAPYASQHQAAHDRLLRRAQAIRRRLGGSPSLATPFPPKPKGMRWTTYARLRAVAEAGAEAWLLATARRFRPRPGEPEDMLFRRPVARGAAAG